MAKKDKEKKEPIAEEVVEETAEETTETAEVNPFEENR